MDILGFKVFEPAPVQKAYNSEYQPITDSMSQLWAKVKASVARPGQDRLDQLGFEGIRIPYYPIPPRTIYDLSKYSDVVRTILLQLGKETFRNGIVVEALYAEKCANCGEEYEEKPENHLCEKCNGTTSEPDEQYKDNFLEYVKCVNENRQSLKEVLEGVHKDVGTMDDGFHLILKEYTFDVQSGEMLDAEIKEQLRGDPIVMRIIADRQGRPGRNDVGKKVYTCVEHRHKVWFDRNKCPEKGCGKQLFQAFFKADMETSGAMGQQGNTGTYYIEGEVIHRSMYHPSLTYGFSPIVTGWQKIVTLMYQDSYIKEYYGKERPPRGLLFVNTSNNASLQSAWQKFRDIQRANPHDIYPIGVEFTKESGSKLVEWIEFVKPLVDMQYTESRTEYRRTIGAIWGVQPIFQGDIQQTGGLNQEGLQITVTNRTVQSNQEYVNFFLAEISRQCGLIKRGWIAKLGPVEIKDEMSEEMLKSQRIANANNMKALGYDAEMKDADLNFEFVKSAAPPAGNSPPTPYFSQPAAAQPPEPSGTPVKSNDKKKAIDLYRDELEIAMKSNEGFVGKANPSPEKMKALENAIFSRNFQGMDRKTSDEIREYLIDAATRRVSYDEMAQYVSEVAGIPVEDADRIVRTEVHELRNKLRELAYEETQPPTATYKWIGPSDARTTSVCKNIVERTAGGVPLDVLKGIIREEGEREGFEPRDFSPHINCRHSFVRYFG